MTALKCLYLCIPGSLHSHISFHLLAILTPDFVVLLELDVAIDVVTQAHNIHFVIGIVADVAYVAAEECWPYTVAVEEC
jgi:hypothetical protein